MRTLLWKEWHEQRWKLAFGSLIVAAFALIGLRARVVADEWMLGAVCGLAALLLPVLSSTGLLPPERQERTLDMLRCLPVQPVAIFSAKLLAGAALYAVPLALALATSLAVAGGRELSSASIIALYARTLGTTLSLYAWMYALTTRLPTETRAALTTLGVLIGWMLVTLGLAQRWDQQQAPSPLWAIDPFMFLVGFNDGRWAVPLIAAFIVQATLAAAQLLWATRQFIEPEREAQR